MVHIITVLIAGSSQRVNYKNSIIHVLNNSLQESKSHDILRFDGVRISHGSKGMVWGSGCDEPIQHILNKVQEKQKHSEKIILNIYGFSRGAITALLTAQAFKNISANQIELNLALIDPVPGNYRLSKAIDPLNISLANNVEDLRDCKTLNNVLALYSNEPMTSWLPFAPIKPKYPQKANVTIDVTPGNHATIQNMYVRKDGSLFALKSFITFVRVFEFLKNNGSQFTSLQPIQIAGIGKTEQHQFKRALLLCYQMLNGYQVEANIRHSLSGTIIISHVENATYLNQHHQQISPNEESKPSHRLSISPNPSIWTKISNFFEKYNRLYQVLKWTGVGLVLSSLLFITGGLGFYACLIVTPILGLISAGISKAVAPLLRKQVQNTFYPHVQASQTSTYVFLHKKIGPPREKTKTFSKPLLPKQQRLSEYKKVSNDLFDPELHKAINVHRRCRFG